MQTLFDALIYSIIPTSTGILFTLYFTEKIKGIVQGKFEKKLEILKKDHNLEIEKFKVDLESLENKQNFKFTKLHEKRFEILDIIYKSLNKTLRDLNQYVSPLKYKPVEKSFDVHENELQKIYVDAYNSFTYQFSDNKIYLNENIVRLIETYFVEMTEIFHDYSENHVLERMGDSSSDRKSKAYEAHKKIPLKILPIKAEIEKEFRVLLES